MNSPVRRQVYEDLPVIRQREPCAREWLVTNGRGGYASGTVAGIVTRRYHGILVAALPSPMGRTMYVNDIVELLQLPDGRTVPLTEPLSGVQGQKTQTHVHGTLVEFRLEQGLPVWRYAVQGVMIEKRIVLPYGHNSVHLSYHMLSGSSEVCLKLHPALCFRSHNAVTSEISDDQYVVTAQTATCCVSAGTFPPLQMTVNGIRASFVKERGQLSEVVLRMEESRGYESTAHFWSPGYFAASLVAGSSLAFTASVGRSDPITILTVEQECSLEQSRRRQLLEMAPAVAQSGPGADLVLAADQFIITPAGSKITQDGIAGAGTITRTVIAGYHWFTDWGRDTMISLEGLTLCTGRSAEAAAILRYFARHISEGLIPNVFDEGSSRGYYNTADATLWFFHALGRYSTVTQDYSLIDELLPQLEEIVDYHVHGTRFGIRVDPADGLLMQGAEGYQLTWMDARVGDWVVTPRRGKAVEINALWYNALRLLEEWKELRYGAGTGERYATMALQVYDAFNQRFWYKGGGYLYDVIDGEMGVDTACRPNQVLSISLPYPVLQPSRWHPVLSVVEQRLLTPVGLRTLDPDHPAYKARYDGDIRARDAAYHQGTVWAWLTGPFIDAWVKANPDRQQETRAFLTGLIAHLDDACIGSISEIFDAEPPYTPRGCIAQAWSVAEVLRCLVCHP